jgi:hypothetical protein
MKSTELSNMRLKQVAVTNALILTAIIIFFIIINVFTITFAHFFLVLGVVMLIQGVFGLIKGDSTKSFFPIFEQVAIYEKQKMGSEWYKQRKIGYVWNLVLSSLLFLQSYWNRDSTDNVFQLEFIFMLIWVFFVLLIVNISLIIHFRKVDRSTSELELKGYTWRSNLIALVCAVVFALFMFVITIFYVISGV